MTKFYAAIIFNATPGWLLQPLPTRFDIVATSMRQVRDEFKALINEWGRYDSTENVIADVWEVTDIRQARADLREGMPGEPDMRLVLGPRGGVRVESF